MALNYSGVFYLDKNGTKHTITTMYRYKKGEGKSTVWTSGSDYDENATPAEYFRFTSLEDDTYSIRAKDVTNMPENVILPTTYKGKAVTQIADFAFVNMNYSTGMPTETCTTLKTIIIPEGYTTVGEHAFLMCANLERVVIPRTVTTVGTSAFLGCDKLVVYCGAESQPEGWKWNPNEHPVIWGYTPLGDDYLTFTEQTDGTYSVKATDVTNLPSVVGIPFSYNGKAVTAIDENAFYSATINKVVIPEGVTHIGNGAFDNCKRLLNVSLPSTLTEIGGWAFRDCTALTSIVIPIGVTTIGTWAFLRDMSLTINCEAASQPSGWHTDWNVSGGTVVWGYAG